MEPHAARFTPLLSPGTSVLLAIVCGAWFVAAMDWIPAALEDDGGAPAWFVRNEIAIPAVDRSVPAPGTFGARTACDSCGTIESVRTMEKKQKGGDVMVALQVVLNAMVGNPMRSPAVRAHEITVRFHDGSKHVITESGMSAWKPGDPVRIINGRIKPAA